MADSRITVRLSAEQSRKLDALAAAASTTKAQALRRLIDAADSVAEQDVEPLDVEGVRRLLSEQARRGSVPAAKAILQHQWQFEKDQAADRELERLGSWRRDDAAHRLARSELTGFVRVSARVLVFACWPGLGCAGKPTPGRAWRK
jgi:predicted DNA-binding protein